MIIALPYFMVTVSGRCLQHAHSRRDGGIQYVRLEGCPVITKLDLTALSPSLTELGCHALERHTYYKKDLEDTSLGISAH